MDPFNQQPIVHLNGQLLHQPLSSLKSIYIPYSGLHPNPSLYPSLASDPTTIIPPSYITPSPQFCSNSFVGRSSLPGSYVLPSVISTLVANTIPTMSSNSTLSTNLSSSLSNNTNSSITANNVISNMSSCVAESSMNLVMPPTNVMTVLPPCDLLTPPVGPESLQNNVCTSSSIQSFHTHDAASHFVNSSPAVIGVPSFGVPPMYKTWDQDTVLQYDTLTQIAISTTALTKKDVERESADIGEREADRFVDKEIKEVLS